MEATWDDEPGFKSLGQVGLLKEEDQWTYGKRRFSAI